jgi:hypothetical protein
MQTHIQRDIQSATCTLGYRQADGLTWTDTFGDKHVQTENHAHEHRCRQIYKYIHITKSVLKYIERSKDI